MKNFKEIAEKCLAGELSGTFVTAFGNNWHSNYLQRHTILGQEIPEQYILGPGVIYNEIGQCKGREEVRIIDFIPDNMRKKIEIDIPEGKVPVMEQTEKGVVITWKEKELTYGNIVASLCDKDQYIKSPQQYTSNRNTNKFNKKVEVLRKLINIRNYFGKPDENKPGWFVEINRKPLKTLDQAKCYPRRVIFATKAHAQAAINMLGDELKYLFEPW
jgi:hypothetical protein